MRIQCENRATISKRIRKSCRVEGVRDVRHEKMPYEFRIQDRVHTKLEMMILSASLEASSRMLSLGVAGAAFLATAFLAAEGAADLETPLRAEAVLLLRPRGVRGLEEIISSRDLSRLADIVKNL